MKLTPDEIKVVEESFEETMKDFIRSAAEWQRSFIVALSQADLKYPIKDLHQYAKEAFMHNIMTFYNNDIEMDGLTDQIDDILNPKK